MHPKGWNESGRPGRPSVANSAAGLPLPVVGLAGSAAHPDHSDGHRYAAVRQRGVIG
jgi:hypothetical protein